MTVPTSSTRGTVAGNGVTTLFNLNFDLPLRHVPNMVLTHVTAAGVENDLVNNVDYTINDSADQFVFPLGGSSYPTLATGEKVVFRLVPPNTQGIDLANQGGLYPEVIEQALDDAAYRDQNMQEQLDRAVKAPVGSTIDPAVLIQTLVESSAAAVDAASDSEDARDEAVAAKVAAEGFKDDAEAAAASADADAAATAADRVQTGLDKAATAADRVQTGLDKAQTTSDKNAAAASAITAGTNDPTGAAETHRRTMGTTELFSSPNLWPDKDMMALTSLFTGTGTMTQI